MAHPPHRFVDFFACIALVVCSSTTFAQETLATPLSRAHAHNDYWHERPLLDALEHGFCSVEADVFLVEGKLLVGHAKNELDPKRSLAALYLDPLKKRIMANNGRVFPGVDRCYLLVDVKSDAEATYGALHNLLTTYKDMLSFVQDGHVHPGAVTVVVSGNRAQETIRGKRTRFVGIDGRPADLDRDEPTHVMPWISENWNSQFRWTGDGPMPAEERSKLRAYVAKAHAHGRLVRFWATPENDAVWQELLAADVDLIGTDKLEKLERFLKVEDRASSRSN